MLIDDERLDLRRGDRPPLDRRRWSKSAPPANRMAEQPRMPRSSANSAASTSTSKRLSQMIFICVGAIRRRSKEGRMSLDAPVKIGKTVIPLHGEAHLIDRADGSRAARGRGPIVGKHRQFQSRRRAPLSPRLPAPAAGPPGRDQFGLIGSGRVGDVRLRGQADFDIVADRAGSGARSCRLTGRRPSKRLGSRARL